LELLSYDVTVGSDEGPKQLNGRITTIRIEVLHTLLSRCLAVFGTFGTLVIILKVFQYLYKALAFGDFCIERIKNGTHYRTCGRAANDSRQCAAARRNDDGIVIARIKYSRIGARWRRNGKFDLIN